MKNMKNEQTTRSVEASDNAQSKRDYTRLDSIPIGSDKVVSTANSTVRGVGKRVVTRGFASESVCIPYNAKQEERRTKTLILNRGHRSDISSSDSAK